jgi:glycerol kinase
LRIERPSPGHVEQDPIPIFQETKGALDEVLSSNERKRVNALQACAVVCPVSQRNQAE